MRRESVQLTLSVSHYQGAPNTSPNTKDFLQAGGTIGRLPANDLVLSDPSRIISGCHARIRYENDAYFLDDVSTNGVFINDATTKIGKGNSVRLTHGDSLRIGDYVLRVDIAAAADSDADPFLAPAPHLEPADPFDPFAPNVHATSTGTSDDLFAPSEPMIPPAAGFGIPDDLDPLDLLNDTPQAPPARPSAGSRSDHIPAENFHFETPRAFDEAIPDDWDKSRQPKTPPPVPSPRPRTDEPPVVVPSAVEILPSPPPGRPSQGAEGALPAAQVLLTAAGLSPDKLGKRPVEELMRDVGVVLRAAVGGLMELLAERSAFKGEFRVDQTMIRPMENNPLKFSGSPEDALKHLLLSSGQAFLGGEEAISQGVQDLKDHRVAMLAAMRTGFEALVRHFDPDHLESTLDSSRKKASVMRLVGKNRAWEAYRQYYAELKQDPDRLFREVIGDVFARAYEDQVARLAKERA